MGITQQATQHSPGKIEATFARDSVVANMRAVFRFSLAAPCFETRHHITAECFHVVARVAPEHSFERNCRVASTVSQTRPCSFICNARVLKHRSTEAKAGMLHTTDNADNRNLTNDAHPVVYSVRCGFSKYKARRKLGWYGSGKNRASVAATMRLRLLGDNANAPPSLGYVADSAFAH